MYGPQEGSAGSSMARHCHLPDTYRTLYGPAGGLGAANLPHLEELDVSECELDSLKGLAELTALRTLRAARNRLGWPSAPHHASGAGAGAGGGGAGAGSGGGVARLSLPQLSELDVGHNGLKSLRSFSLCLRLQTLRAPGNRLPALEPMPELSLLCGSAPPLFVALRRQEGKEVLCTINPELQRFLEANYASV